MKLFIIFIAFWLGAVFKQSWIIFLIISLLYFIFLFKRFNFRTLLACLTVFITAHFYSSLSVSEHKEAYEGVVYQAKENYFLFNSNGERFYVSNYENEYDIGDVLNIKGYRQELDFEVLESAFDFNHYLRNKGISYELVIQEITINYSSPLRLNNYRIYILDKYDENCKNLMGSILFSTYEETNLTNSLNDLHLARLLSNSGLYLYAIIKFLEGLISFKIKKKFARLISIVILSFYSVLTFPRFTVIRILFLLTLRWINKYVLKNKYKDISLISFSGLFFLILNPYLALQDSFILGYIFPIFFFICGDLLYKKKGIKGLLFKTLVIYLFFLPFELKYYNSTIPLSPLMTIIYSPFYIIFAIISFVGLGGIDLSIILNPYANFLNHLLSFIKPLKLELFLPNFSNLLILIYYLIFFSLLYFVSIGFKPIYNKISILFVSLLTIYTLPIDNLITTTVSFINVGQGDACLINHKNTTILIDTGGKTYMDVAKETLIPFLKKKRIYNIDLVITTHDDFDHSGALDSLVKNFKVKRYIKDKSAFPLSIGDIDIRNLNQEIYDNENDNSLVLYFRLMDKSFLIMGDAGKVVEEDLIENYSSIPCDILKIGHHGSNTSTSMKFINFLKPKEAVISVGDNTYGHPHYKVISILNEANIKIRRTDMEGTVTYKNYNLM